MYLTEPYHQGDTIGFYHEGDSVINLDTNPFKLLFYNAVAPKQRVLIDKSEMTFISTNKYYAEIPNTVTALLQRGNYIMEQLYGASYTSISKEDAFILEDSQIKSEL
jgi:hypothetical protein